MSALRASFTPLVLAVSAVPLLAAGCVDPGQRLSDFQNDVVDAAIVEIPDGQVLDEIPDIGGTWYVVFAPVPTPDVPIHTRWEVEFERVGETSAKINVLSRPLNKDTRVLVEAPFMLHETTINQAGEFTLSGEGMPLPTGTSALEFDITVNLKLNARIKSKDFMCGVMVEGNVVAPNVPLNGTPFAAQRVAPGTEGDDLPPPLTECPPDLPDAGVPDAGAPDASPDAAVDAAVDAAN
jgi:hypothetical protein